MGFTVTIPASHPWQAFLGLAVTQVVLSLGQITQEQQGIESTITEMTIPTQNSSNTMEYDTDGVVREITVTGQYTGTAQQVSDWIVGIEALQNCNASQGLNAPYVLSYTAGSFPTYPYTLYASGTTPRTYNVIVESFNWNRVSDNPTSDIVYYTLKFKERAVSQ
jgi:hypothetical protein